MIKLRERRSEGVRWLFILLNSGALAIHLHPISQRGVELAVVQVLGDLKDNSVNGRAKAGSLLCIEFCKVLVGSVTDPGIAILSVVQANQA
jgi:hypothetical protein